MKLKRKEQKKLKSWAIFFSGVIAFGLVLITNLFINLGNVLTILLLLLIFWVVLIRYPL